MSVTARSRVGFDITPVDRSSPLQTSSQQRRIWFADQFDKSGLQFIYSHEVRLRGPLDLGALGSAIELLIARHEILRTRIVAIDGEPWQIAMEPYSIDSTPEQVADESALGEAIDRFVNRRFDLAEGRFLRAKIFRLAEDDHVLVWTIHHIATDGWSNGLIMSELAMAYNAIIAGEEPELEPLRVQHGDYAHWERNWLAGGGANGDLAYWRKQLADAPTMLNLPVDRPWPATQSFRGDWRTAYVLEETIVAAERLGESEHASLFMILLAAFQLTLARWTGQHDLIVGTATANRTVPGTEHLVGPFINMLPLRGQVDESVSFRAFLRQVRDTTLDAFDHEMAPFDRIVEEISPERSLARNAIIQVTLTGTSYDALGIKGVEAEDLQRLLKTVRFDLTFYYSRQADGRLRVDANYASDILDAATVETLLARFLSALSTTVSSPDRPLCTTAATTSEELALIERWSAGEPAQHTQALIHEDVAHQAAFHPDRVAIVAADKSLTFAQLNTRADKIAGLLTTLGVTVESPVGILMGRSEALISAILGVLKSGAYYVPLDPTYPAERLAEMLQDSGVKVVLTDDGNVDYQSNWPTDIQFTPVSAADLLEPVVPKPLDGANLAYAIYTSGSTGGPKPVLVTHAGVANLLRSLELAGAAGPGHDRVGWNASCSFDASVQQWIRLARGDTLVMITEAQRGDPLALSHLIESAGLSHLDITPTHLDLLIDHLPARPADSEPLRLLIGGEPIRPALWNRIEELESDGIVRGINLYGPTEATVDATATRVTVGSPNIGRPMQGRQVAVVDAWFRPVPPGVAGELLIGGVGLGRGYGNRPGLTATRYVASPFRSDGSRLYRTGDRVRWRHDGSLEYLGRWDRQIKLRGFRIELDEVDSVLSSMPGVGVAITTVRDLPGGPGLVAYCTPTGKEPLNPAAIRAYAASKLPTFMVPEVIIIVSKMPFGSGGKVDESQLPDPNDVGSDGSGETLAGPIEALIAEIWCQILGVADIGPSDNFFSMGGHSMQATRMIAILRKRINLSLPITAIFKYPRLRALAQHVEAIIRERIAADAGAPAGNCEKA